MRTAKEIKAEVAALKKLRGQLPKLSPRGEENHTCIDAQIEVLNNKFTEDDIYERGDIETTPTKKFWNSDVRNSAMSALNWKLGESFEAPSVDWDVMLKKG